MSRSVSMSPYNRHSSGFEPADELRADRFVLRKTKFGPCQRSGAFDLLRDIANWQYWVHLVVERERLAREFNPVAKEVRDPCGCEDKPFCLALLTYGSAS